MHPLLCGANEMVQENACVGCPAGKSNAPGDDASRANTECDIVYCAEDENVKDNVCLTCPAGKVNAKGDDASGEDTACDTP